MRLGLTPSRAYADKRTWAGVRGWTYAAGADVTGADTRLGGRGRLDAAGADAAAYGVIRWTSWVVAHRSVNLEAVVLCWGLGGGHAGPKTWRRSQTRCASEAEQQGKADASMAASREVRLSLGWQGGKDHSRQGSAVKTGRVVL